MLSGGASFIDKAGIEQNELTYESNIAAQNAPETEATTDGNTPDQTSSDVVHFE